jgi:hypothetical protein
MFQLVELILSSPIGAFLFTGLQKALFAVILVADCDECGFNDLGKLLLGGVAAAILVGVIVSLLLRRQKEKESYTPSFVSIRNSGQADDV